MENMQSIRYYLGLVDDYKAPEGYDCYVWAGTFCTNGIEWCVRNGKKYEVLQEDVTTDEDIHRTYLYLDCVRDKIIDFLKNMLNEYHQSDYSKFKWQIMLNFWLACFLPSVYDKYLKLKRIANDSRVFYVDLYEASCLSVAIDMLDFSEILHDDFNFHRYEYSLLIKHITGISNIVVDYHDNYKRQPLNIYSTKLPEHVKSFDDKYRRYKENTKIYDEIVIQSPYIKFNMYKEIIEKAYGKISGYFLDYTHNVRNCLDYEKSLDVGWRTRRQCISGETDQFVNLICDIIGCFIPMVYVEEFQHITKIALDNYKWGLKPKTVVYDCEGVTINELFKAYLMNIDVENVLKIDIMHALPYGMGGYSWYELTELQFCDEFLKCGEIQNNNLKAKLIRMPYINFFRQIDNIHKKTEFGNAIVYANYAYPQHRGRLSMYEWNWYKYIKGELEFLQLLDKDILSELRYRPHPFHKTQWNNLEKVKQFIPSLLIDEEPSFFESIRHAKLFISEIMGAAAFEAIGIGKPTIIMFYPERGFAGTDENRSDIEDMLRVGIIAETPEKLAALVNDIHNDIEGWWGESERQRVVNKIRDKYVYFPKNAKEIWINKIVSYLKQ